MLHPTSLRQLVRHGMVLATVVATPVLSAAANVVENNEPQSGEYRVTLFPYHKLTDDLTGFGYLGYVDNPDKSYTTDYLGYGLSVMTRPNVQWWGGLIGTYTENEFDANRLELRPFVGLKNFIPNHLNWHIYNYARWEVRSLQDRDNRDWSTYSRFRNRVGIEFPLATAERAWQPGTWYGLADVEAFYRFDHMQVDPIRLRIGFARVFSNRVRAEFIYHVQWTRPGEGPLDYTDNIFRLNIKIALNRGVLPQALAGGSGFD